MPLIKSASPVAFKSNVKAEMAARPQKQALAIAFRVQRDAKKKKMARGGRTGYAPGGAALPTAPFQMRSQARDIQRAGMIHSPTAGRADKLPMGVKAGSFIVPADTVSSLGQGNSIAGANALNRMFKQSPYGSGMAGPPRRPGKFADGGDVGAPDAAPVPILASGGEYVIDPESVARIGGGSLEKGHDILDSMVMQTRKKTIKTLRKLPKPRKR